MAIYTIKTSTVEAHYKKVAAIEGTDYTFQFDWNERESKWYMRIYFGDEILVSGVKIIINFPLLRNYVDERLPPGIIYAIDTYGNGEDPGLNDFGTRVILLYATQDEFDG